MRLLTKTDDVRNNSTIVDHNDDNDADQNDEHIDSQFTTTTKQSKNVEVDDASEFKWTPILNEHDINTLPWNILILLGILSSVLPLFDLTLFICKVVVLLWQIRWLNLVFFKILF